MSRYFVVGANPITDKEQTAIREWLSQYKSTGWWNWIDGFWLIVDFYSLLTVEEIRDEFVRIAPNADVMVLQVSRLGTWAGYGPTEKNHNMFDWMHDQWKNQ